MEHWLVSCNSMQCLVKDVRMVILSKLARLNAMKFFITPHCIDDSYFNLVANFDIIWRRMSENSDLICAEFPHGRNGSCKYKPNIDIEDSGFEIETIFTDKIYIVECEHTFFDELNIYGGIDTDDKKSLCYNVAGPAKIVIHCLAEVYEIDAPFDHICIDVYKKI